MTDWRLVNYFDVWGNEVDGYEVNNLCVEREQLTIPENATDKDILRYLERFGFLSTSDMRRVKLVDYGNGWIEIETVKHGCPLGRLERIW